MSSDIKKINDTYEKNINLKIEKLKSQYDFVYHIMHPFEINLDAKNGLYNSDLEDKYFDYQLNSLLLEYFGTLNGLEDNADQDVVLGSILGTIDLGDIESWWTMSKDGVPITKESHPIFMKRLDELARPHFTKFQNSEKYNDDDHINNIIWNWEPLSWKKLCSKLQIEYNSDLRLSRLNNWFHEIGLPKNIRYPKEVLPDETISKLKEILSSTNKYELITGNDDYITLIGNNIEISEKLKKLNLEFILFQ